MLISVYYILTVIPVEDQGSYQTVRDTDGKERLQCYCIAIRCYKGRLPDHLFYTVITTMCIVKYFYYSYKYYYLLFITVQKSK